MYYTYLFIVGHNPMCFESEAKPSINNEDIRVNGLEISRNMVSYIISKNKLYIANSKDIITGSDKIESKDF